MPRNSICGDFRRCRAWCDRRNTPEIHPPPKNQVNALKTLKIPCRYNVGILSVLRRCGERYLPRLTRRTADHGRWWCEPHATLTCRPWFLVEEAWVSNSAGNTHCHRPFYRLRCRPSRMPRATRDPGWAFRQYCWCEPSPLGRHHPVETIRQSKAERRHRGQRCCSVMWCEGLFLARGHFCLLHWNAI